MSAVFACGVLRVSARGVLHRGSVGRMTTTTRIALAIAAFLGFAWGPLLGLPADATPHHKAPSWAHGLPACVYEDGSGGPLPCYWDAGNMGNGRGQSLINWPDDTWSYVPFCTVAVRGHRIRVQGYGFDPADRVAARVNGRTLRGTLDADSRHVWRTVGRYSAADVRARVNGQVCERAR